MEGTRQLTLYDEVIPMNLSLHFQFDACRCLSCGRVFFHTWTSREMGVPAIERFPIECDECGAVDSHRMSEEKIAEYDRAHDEAARADGEDDEAP